MRPHALSVYLIGLLGLGGCSNLCEEALVHVNECLQLEAPDTEEDPECDVTDECKAECALDASCEAFIDASSSAGQVYQACVAGC